MLVLIAQIKRFGTLNATQKTEALYKALFLKKSRKTARSWPFLTRMHFWLFLGSFSWFFQKRCCVEGCGFLRCIQCPKTLNLSYQKTTFGRVPYGQKVTRSRKKGQKFFKKKSFRTKMEQENWWWKLFHHKWCFRGHSTGHTVHTLHTVHTVQAVWCKQCVHTIHTWHAVYTVHTEHTVHTVHIEHTVRTVHTL